MVLTTPMVFAETDGIELVLLNHTCTREPSVICMRDFYYLIVETCFVQCGAPMVQVNVENPALDDSLVMDNIFLDPVHQQASLQSSHPI